VLVGIAKLASESVTLEAKSRVQYFEIAARSVLNRTKPDMPFTWTVNPYRGCEFGCKYCYARYTHEFMEQDPALFEDRIYAKSHPAELIAHDLRKVDPGEGIAIGTATDPYQPAERRYGRTRAILEVLARGAGRRISITTKGDLVARDIDVLQKITARNSLFISMTITTLDSKLARMMEPRAPRPDLRLKAVGQLAAAGIRVGVGASPIMPLINDGEPALARLAKAARDAGARHFTAQVLFLRNPSKKVFLDFLAERFPQLSRRYHERYDAAVYLKGSYPETIRARVCEIRDRYGLDGYPKPEPEPEAQPALFDYASI
jgi:DNA repair photolyase